MNKKRVLATAMSALMIVSSTPTAALAEELGQPSDAAQAVAAGLNPDAKGGDELEKAAQAEQSATEQKADTPAAKAAQTEAADATKAADEKAAKQEEKATSDEKATADEAAAVKGGGDDAATTEATPAAGQDATKAAEAAPAATQAPAFKLADHLYDYGTLSYKFVDENGKEVYSESASLFKVGADGITASDPVEQDGHWVATLTLDASKVDPASFAPTWAVSNPQDYELDASQSKLTVEYKTDSTDSGATSYYATGSNRGSLVFVKKAAEQAPAAPTADELESVYGAVTFGGDATSTLPAYLEQGYYTASAAPEKQADGTYTFTVTVPNTKEAAAKYLEQKGGSADDLEYDDKVSTTTVTFAYDAAAKTWSLKTPAKLVLNKKPAPAITKDNFDFSQDAVRVRDDDSDDTLDTLALIEGTYDLSKLDMTKYTNVGGALVIDLPITDAQKYVDAYNEAHPDTYYVLASDIANSVTLRYYQGKWGVSAQSSVYVKQGEKPAEKADLHVFGNPENTTTESDVFSAHVGDKLSEVPGFELNPTKDGWKFDGWFLDKDYTKPADGDTKVASAWFAVYGKWERTNSYALEAKASAEYTPEEAKAAFGYTGSYKNGDANIAKALLTKAQVNGKDLDVAGDLTGSDPQLKVNVWKNGGNGFFDLVAGKEGAYTVDFTLGDQKASTTVTVKKAPVQVVLHVHGADANDQGIEDLYPGLSGQKLSEVKGFEESPSADGYTFEGWYTQPDGQGEKVTGDTVLPEGTNQFNIYAYWKYADTYTLSVPAEQTITPEVAQSLRFAEFSKYVEALHAEGTRNGKPVSPDDDFWNVHVTDVNGNGTAGFGEGKEGTYKVTFTLGDQTAVSLVTVKAAPKAPAFDAQKALNTVGSVAVRADYGTGQGYQDQTFTSVNPEDIQGLVKSQSEPALNDQTGNWEVTLTLDPAAVKAKVNPALGDDFSYVEDGSRTTVTFETSGADGTQWYVKPQANALFLFQKQAAPAAPEFNLNADGVGNAAGNVTVRTVDQDGNELAKDTTGYSLKRLFGFPEDLTKYATATEPERQADGTWKVTVTFDASTLDPKDVLVSEAQWGDASQYEFDAADSQQTITFQTEGNSTQYYAQGSATVTYKKKAEKPAPQAPAFDAQKALNTVGSVTIQTDDGTGKGYVEDRTFTSVNPEDIQGLVKSQSEPALNDQTGNWEVTLTLDPAAVKAKANPALGDDFQFVADDSNLTVTFETNGAEGTQWYVKAFAGAKVSFKKQAEPVVPAKPTDDQVKAALDNLVKVSDGTTEKAYGLVDGTFTVADPVKGASGTYTTVVTVKGSEAQKYVDLYNKDVNGNFVPSDTSDLLYYLTYDAATKSWTGAAEQTFFVKAAAYDVTVDLGYDGDGDGMNDTQVVSVKNGEVLKFEAPARDGYEFKGLTYDAEGKQAYDQSKPVVGSLKLYAQWEKKAEQPAEAKITVSLNDGEDGGAAYDATVGQKLSEVKGLDARYKNPQRDGYTFLGWKSNQTGETSLDPVISAEAEAFSAQWEKNETPAPTEHTVTVSLGYDGDGDGQEDTQAFQVTDGDKFDFTAPEREGYEFKGLTYDAEGKQAYDQSKPVVGNLKLYAQWDQKAAPKPEQKVTITVEDDEITAKPEQFKGLTGDAQAEALKKAFGVKAVDAQGKDVTADVKVRVTNVSDEQDVSSELAAGKVRNYGVTFYYGEGESYSSVSCSLFVKNDSTPATKYFDVTIHKGFDADNDGTEDTQVIRVEEGGKITIKEAWRTGYTYKGLAYDREGTRPYDLDTPVTGNLDLYAQWQKNGEDNEGTTPEDQNQNKAPEGNDDQNAPKGNEDKKGTEKGEGKVEAESKALPQTSDTNAPATVGIVAAAGAAIAALGAWISRRRHE